MNPILTLIQGAIANRVSSTFESSPRWAIVSVLPGVDLYGIVVGRRFVRTAGVALVLALRADGTFRPYIAPAEEVAYRPELDVRRAFVRASRQVAAVRGHDLVLSPACAELCAICALDQLAHDRDRVRLAIEAVAKSTDVQLNFVERSATVRDARVRPPAELAVTMNPVPEPEEPGAVRKVPKTTVVRPYRSLAPEEWNRVRAMGVEVVA